MELLKALIIDQNILVRRVIARILFNYNDFSTYCITDDYKNAEDLIHTKSPDVIMIGIDSIRSSGITLLHTIHLRFPDLPIVVITPKNKEGAEAAINALKAGAVDFISRPEHKNLVMFAERHFKKRLKPILKAAKSSAVNQEKLNSFIKPKKTLSQIKRSSPAEVVVMAGGTGGARALFTVLAALPEDLQVPIVIVQHMPRIYTKYLASKLDTVSDLTVREAQNGVTLKKGDVWVAPGGYQCQIKGSDSQPKLSIQREAKINDRRPSADILFQSASRSYGENTLAILLSGTGNDGISGVHEIKRRGGEIIVQDPRTAIASDLPLAIIKKGLTSGYYFSEELADQMVKRTSTVPSTPVTSNGHDDEAKGDDLIFM